VRLSHLTRASALFVATIFLELLLLGGCSRKSTDEFMADTSSKYHPGQVWTFKAPTNQPNTRLTILKVESTKKLGTIIHVALSGVSYGPGQTTIGHLPFSEEAIDESVLKLERESGPIPEFIDGYKRWREAFDGGKAGIFTIGVADAFEAVTGLVPKQKI
jgi:hypothetical protein